MFGEDGGQEIDLPKTIFHASGTNPMAGTVKRLAVATVLKTCEAQGRQRPRRMRYA